MLQTNNSMQPVGEIIRIGGGLDRTSASLRFFHDDLDPDFITQLLDCEPSQAQRKGDLLPSKRLQRIAHTGSWRLQTAIGNAQVLEDQIRGLLNQVSADLSKWEQLSQFGMSRMDVFCGLHLKEWNRGFSLSAELMKMLGERYLEIGFDIYCDEE